jgi:hypothetical protein
VETGKEKKSSKSGHQVVSAEDKLESTVDKGPECSSGVLSNGSGKAKSGSKVSGSGKFP